MASQVKDMSYWLSPEGKKEMIEISKAILEQHEPYGYPSKYFEKNNKQKPSVSLLYKDVDLDTLRPFVVKSIEDGTISSDLAAQFLWKYGERFRATVTEKWESFGVTISEPGEVKLNSIIDVKFRDAEIPNLPEKVGMVSSKDDDWIASFLTSIYRIKRAENEKYRSQLSATALNVLNKNCGKGSNANLNLTNTRLPISILCGSNYCKIIACFDMFLHKTKIKKYQFLRWGTISSRYRDCSALSTWIDIANQCGFKNLTDLKKIIIFRDLDTNVSRLLKGGQEIDKPDSYMPYIIDFGITYTKSPYSARSNPSLYSFLSTLGVYMGLKGLTNVKESSPDTRTVYLNGLILAYLLNEKDNAVNKSTDNSGSTIKKDFLDAEETRRQLNDYIKSKGTVISGPLKEFKKSIDATIVNPRPETIGHYLTQCFI